MKVTRTPTGKPPLAGQRGDPSSAGRLLISLVSLHVCIARPPLPVSLHPSELVT